MSFPFDDTGGNIIALGEFDHVADATPGFFTHWSTLTNIGTVTITIENESTVTISVRITRFSGPDIDIDINAAGTDDNNRSVTVPGAKALLISEDTAADVFGDYVIVLN